MLPKLLAEIVAAEHAKLWRSSVKLAIVMSLLGLAVMAVVVGMVFVLYGLYLSLVETFPPWQAGVIVGGIVVFFAVILLMVIAQQSRAVPIKSSNPPEQAVDDPSAQLGAVIGDIVAKSDVKSSDFVLTALIAGIVLGASPSLRQRILTTLSGLTKPTDK